MAYTVIRTSRNGTASGCYKTLDDAMRRASMVHEDGKGYTTTVMSGDTVIAELYSCGNPTVHDERYMLIPKPTDDWRKKPTKYSVYKRI